MREFFTVKLAQKSQKSNAQRIGLLSDARQVRAPSMRNSQVPPLLTPQRHSTKFAPVARLTKRFGVDWLSASICPAAAQGLAGP